MFIAGIVRLKERASAETRCRRGQKTNIIAEECKECDSGAFECSPSESDRIRDEGPAYESPTSFRALDESFAVDIGDHNEPAVGDRDTQVFAAADVLQGRGSTKPSTVSSLSACLIHQKRVRRTACDQRRRTTLTSSVCIGKTVTLRIRSQSLRNNSVG